MKEYRRIENDDGSVVESYWSDGEKHREDGPAEIERRVDGTVIESYWQNGQRHRVDHLRPALIVRGSNGRESKRAIGATASCTATTAQHRSCTAATAARRRRA